MKKILYDNQMFTFQRFGGVTRYFADLIYNPSKTKLLLDAEKLSIPAVNGLTMLCAQGAKAAESFTKTKFPENKATEITKELEKQMLNIALVGMPGCGKSTAGKILSQILGREFVDTDELIVKNEDRAIPEIFEAEGEEYFRNLESEAVFEVSVKQGKIRAKSNRHIKILIELFFITLLLRYLAHSPK